MKGSYRMISKHLATPHLPRTVTRWYEGNRGAVSTTIVIPTHPSQTNKKHLY